MYDKNTKTTNFDYGNKAFLEIKIYFSHTHLSSMFYNDIMIFISSSSAKMNPQKQSYVLFKFKW